MIEPYGGVLIDRTVKSKETVNKMLSAKSLRVEITEDVLLEIDNIANGAYSPLKGFPTGGDVRSVLKNWRLSNGMLFPIPPLCHVNDKSFQEIKTGNNIIFTFHNKPVGAMFVIEKYKLDKLCYVQAVFSTKDKNHPGVSLVLNMSGNMLAGPIKKFGAKSMFFGKDALTPSVMRRKIKRKGWNTIVAFSTSNVPHRAHEHLQRIALEVLDGLVIHPLLIVGGSMKFTRNKISSCYKALIDNYFPKENVIFSFLPILPRNAGPRSALMQGIIRQNFGCTHQIIGRDHDGFKSYYSVYGSQQIFDEFPEIKLVPLKLMEPYYCKKCGSIVTEKNCSHSKNGISISGTILREKMNLGEDIPDYFIRREVLEAFKTS
jgi:sulfate adenylyltransferase